LHTIFSEKCFILFNISLDNIVKQC
jgi:hypothetical protein